jgi:hypothetical protein
MSPSPFRITHTGCVQWRSSSNIRGYRLQLPPAKDVC